VDRKTMGLITSLQRQVESQEERLSHLSTRIAQVEEAGRMSELTAQAAHIRADNSDEKYRAAKRELDILRADNARLTDQVREAAAAKEADQSVIAELRLHIQENMSRIESLELELSKHRRATHIAAEITLHDTQE
jgi:chromosome segregation ATPase